MSVQSVCAAALLALTLSACATPPAPPTAAAAPSAAPFQGLWHHPDDPRVWAWVSSPWTFSTTSYAVEGDDGLVLIDTQFLSSDAAAFVDAVEGATGKAAKVAVVLHANPDKFNGTATLQARGIRVVTSAAVQALLPEVHDKRVRAFADRYGDAYPRALPAPATVADDAVIDDVAGVSVALRATGAGCSAAHVIARVDTAAGRHVFGGDLLANGSHLWLELGEVQAWRERLDEVEALAPRFVHPGRGLSGDVSLVTDARAYLGVVEAAVANSADVKGADAAVRAAYPSRRFAVFLGVGLPTLLAKKAGAVAPSH